MATMFARNRIAFHRPRAKDPACRAFDAMSRRQAARRMSNQTRWCPALPRHAPVVAEALDQEEAPAAVADLGRRRAARARTVEPGFAISTRTRSRADQHRQLHGCRRPRAARSWSRARSPAAGRSRAAAGRGRPAGATTRAAPCPRLPRLRRSPSGSPPVHPLPCWWGPSRSVTPSNAGDTHFRRLHPHPRKRERRISCRRRSPGLQGCLITRAPETPTRRASPGCERRIRRR